MTGPDTRFAIYGSLAPGRVNHHHLELLKGRWSRGTVTGRLVEAGWGAALGFPGLVLDPQGAAVEVSLLESPDLPEHWDRLDALEGPSYRRVVAPVATDEGPLDAWIYVVVL
ncbi:MAG: gamma-glutamylcyclotransferase family protein [Geminicoccaceae bacterium]